MVIAESSLEVQWDTHGADIPPGEYLIYRTYQDGDYFVWLESKSGVKTPLFTCFQCITPITGLQALSGNHWMITTNNFDPYTSGGEVILIDPLRETTQRIECRAVDSNSYCRLRQISDYGVLFSITDATGNDTFFSKTMAGDWVTLAGTLFQKEALTDLSFYNNLGNQGILVQQYAETQSSQNELYFYSLANQELTDWSGLLSGSQEEVVDFLGSSPNQEWIALGKRARQVESTQSLNPYESVTICPYEVLVSLNKITCYKIADLKDTFPVYWAGSIFWLDDRRLMLVRSGGIGQNMQIGTLDMQGGLDLLYIGPHLSLLDITHDYHWMLFEKNGTYGLLNLQDGSTSYLGLPENASFVTWLTIP